MISLTTAQLTAPPNVIAILERLLYMARSGEILSLAYITVEPGGTVGTGFESDLNFKHAHHMVAGSVYLQKRLEQNSAE